MLKSVLAAIPGVVLDAAIGLCLLILVVSLSQAEPAANSKESVKSGSTPISDRALFNLTKNAIRQ